MKTLVTLAVSLIAFACTTTPETNRKALNLVPDSQLNELGTQAFAELNKSEKAFNNNDVRNTIIRVGSRIAKASGADFDWQFQVYDAPGTVNAFCLPGGKIGVYTGILPIAQSEAGLAAVLGHEVAHATAKHAGERLSQALLINLGLTAADLKLSNNKYKSLILAGLGVGAQIGVLLPYNRKQESEADQIGLIYMARAGYQPREAVAFWERMAAKDSRSATPEFLSTHPKSSERMAALRAALPRVEKEYLASDKQASGLIRL